jgi:hypothetical protein
MAGNANSGRRERHFLTALLMELKSAGSDMPRLRNIARALIDKAEEGDMAAIKEFADRIDGKVPQGLEHTGHIDTRTSELTDDDLERIATTSGAGTVETPPSPSKLN